MINSYETFDLEMSGEKIKSLLDFLANNREQLQTLIQENPDMIDNINQILNQISSEINDIKNVTTIDGGEY